MQFNFRILCRIKKLVHIAEGLKQKMISLKEITVQICGNSFQSLAIFFMVKFEQIHTAVET